MEQSQAVGVPSKEATVSSETPWIPFLEWASNSAVLPLHLTGPSVPGGWHSAGRPTPLKSVTDCLVLCHFLVKWVLYLTTVLLMGFGLAG